MINSTTTTIDIDDLINTHGEEKADELLEHYKQFHKPDIPLTPDFAIQVVRELPHGFAKVNPAITTTLRELGLFAEWQNPAQLNVWEN